MTQVMDVINILPANTSAFENPHLFVTQAFVTCCSFIFYVRLENYFISERNNMIRKKVVSPYFNARKFQNRAHILKH